VTALDPAREAGQPARAAGSECVQAAAIWYGVFDYGALVAAHPGTAEALSARFLGCKAACTAADYAPASPVNYIDAKDPPVLLIHGNDDRTVPVAQSHLAETKLKAAGVPVEATYIPGVDHSFIGTSPEATRAATLGATNLTFDFFHKLLDGAGR